MKLSRRPPALYILCLLLAFQAISALGGGSVILLDPTGVSIGFPPETLRGTPFPNFIIPGIILFFVLGVLPAILVYALLARPLWPWANALNIYRDRHWAWTYALYVGIMLIVWIDVQIWMVGYGMFIQTFYAFMGLAIVVAALWPSVWRYYRLSDTHVAAQ